MRNSTDGFTCYFLTLLTKGCSASILRTGLKIRRTLCTFRSPTLVYTPLLHIFFRRLAQQYVSMRGNYPSSLGKLCNKVYGNILKVSPQAGGAKFQENQPDTGQGSYVNIRTSAFPIISGCPNVIWNIINQI